MSNEQSASHNFKGAFNLTDTPPILRLQRILKRLQTSLFDGIKINLPGTVGIVDNGVDVVPVISIISPLNNSVIKLKFAFS